MGPRSTPTLTAFLSCVLGLAAFHLWSDATLWAQQPGPLANTASEASIPPQVQAKLDNLQAALNAARAAGNAEGQAKALGGMAIQYLALQQNQKALSLSVQALSLFRESGDRAGQAAGNRRLDFFIFL